MAEGGVTKAEKGHRPARMARWLWSARGAPHGDVAPWSVAAGCLPITKEENPCCPFAWRRFVDRFIHGNGNDNAVVTLRRAQSPCALCRGDRASFAGKETREAGASPSLLARLGEPGHLTRLGEAGSLAELRVASEASSRGEVPREGNPSRGSPGLESLALGEIF